MALGVLEQVRTSRLPGQILRTITWTLQWQRCFSNSSSTWGSNIVTLLSTLNRYVYPPTRGLLGVPLCVDPNPGFTLTNTSPLLELNRKDSFQQQDQIETCCQQSLLRNRQRSVFDAPDLFVSRIHTTRRSSCPKATYSFTPGISPTKVVFPRHVLPRQFYV